MQLENVYTSQTPEETAAFARKIAAQIRPQDVILLKGELGAGKSTFARDLIQTLCGKETEVPSPTFTLVQTYETPSFILWHFDLYRLEDYDTFVSIGGEEIAEDPTTIMLIEWPEILGDRVQYTKKISIELMENGGREINIIIQ